MSTTATATTTTAATTLARSSQKSSNDDHVKDIRVMRTSDASVFKFTLDYSQSTLQDLKDEICNSSGGILSSEKQRLFFLGRELTNANKTLQKLGIGRHGNFIVHLHVRSCSSSSSATKGEDDNEEATTTTTTTTRTRMSTTATNNTSSRATTPLSSTQFFTATSGGVAMAAYLGHVGGGTATTIRTPSIHSAMYGGSFSPYRGTTTTLGGGNNNNNGTSSGDIIDLLESDHEDDDDDDEVIVLPNAKRHRVL